MRALKNIPPVLEILYHSGPRLVIGGVVMRLFAALVPVAMLWVSKLIIDTVVASVKAPGSPPEHNVIILLLLDFGLAGLGNVLGRGTSYCDARLAEEFSREVSVRIMSHAARLDLQSFEDPAFYDVLERARVQATDRAAMLSAMGQLLQQAVTLISLSAGVILFSPLLFVLLVVCVVPAFIGESHFAFLGYSLAYSLTPLRREMDYIRTLGTSKESAKEVKLFGLGDHLRDRFGAMTERLISQTRALALRRFRAGSLLALIGSAGYYGAYAILVVRTMHGELSVGDLTFLAGALAGSSTQIQTLFSTFSGIADQSLFLTDLLQFFAVEPKMKSTGPSIPAPRPIRDGFEFRKVSFHYPGVQRLILDRLDLRIEAQERLALVGENGQGKTTFVKLMARLYDPTAGQILLDGVDLRDYRVEDLQREIGVIFQDFMRYDLRARDNIGVGQIERLDDLDRIAAAARKSGADAVIERLPRGLDQMLGRRFDTGVDLSGGEWQKFALARAYMRESQVLILDEPTAALDAVSEYEVFRQFAELMTGRMAVLISHRFSTVRMCDRIIVLEGGRIHEQGTHRQLVERGGRYARMFELQAASYR